jgi:hypothetical protein
VGACHPENPVAGVKPGFLGWNVLGQPGHIDAQNEREGEFGVSWSTSCQSTGLTPA